MGMFDRDKTLGGLRLDQEFTIGNGDARGPDGGEVFVLLDITVMDEKIDLHNDLPPAEKTLMRVCRWDSEKLRATGEVFDVGSLSQAIAGKAREKADGDLPALVRAHVAKARNEAWNDATVLTFVGPYDGPTIVFNTFDVNMYVPSSDSKASSKAKVAA
jgi:hypothetical protein